MNFDFKTIQEFNDFFKDEKTCYEFLEISRWNGTPVCSHCGTAKKPYTVKSRGKFKDIPTYRCSERHCDLPFTVRSGGIFEGSQVELRKWFHAIYELSTSKKGISSIELSTRIGVSQKTAWFMNHRLRDMLSNNQPEMLGGEVEIDETFVGGNPLNKHQNKVLRNERGGTLKSKQPIIGMKERGGRVIAKVIEARLKEIMIPVILGSLKQDAEIITDEFNGYNDLSKIYKHSTINHKNKKYVDGKIHTNTIENFWSIFKRGIIGTYHFVSAKHLQKYCDEFATRHNFMKIGNLEIFKNILSNTDQKRVTYATLTAQ